MAHDDVWEGCEIIVVVRTPEFSPSDRTRDRYVNKIKNAMKWIPVDDIEVVVEPKLSVIRK